MIPAAWAGMHCVLISQQNTYARQLTPDEARTHATELLRLADIADGLTLGRTEQ
ncbi:MULTISPECIES: hypothetical protein [unclassified Rhodococcus (in: high G+C Gram-positive bacteria)]|uniref:hypothetical protein n=1 Tax=unclassified Rhodococcus (in: high G+C Gram-positive bacteria) TaxID=192944 RepID=UPI001595C241|nr:MULTISPECIES: hypothetical protein [unclassified Rhodococcus (in: high G+C Gram-positive bacteria)]